jgi:hypothetical protein
LCAKTLVADLTDTYTVRRKTKNNELLISVVKWLPFLLQSSKEVAQNLSFLKGPKRWLDLKSLPVNS